MDFYDVFPGLKPGRWYGNYDEKKYKEFNFWYSVPFIRPLMDYDIDKARSDSYMQRFGLNYSDILDPRKMLDHQSTSNLYGSGMNFVSSNWRKLYR